MPSDPRTEAHRLFDELADLTPAARRVRLAALDAGDALTREVASLLDAAERAGDFLGLIGGAGTDDAALTLPGALVAGRYRIQRPLGAGAMGHVHLAHDALLERPVALKFLRAGSRADVDIAALARFRDEARAAARLDHPHVGTLHDIGETPDGTRFLVMTHYPGETLRERIARGPRPRMEALRVGAQLAGALAAAHAAGIIHRDVKPGNVLFDAGGGARLTDFGIAAWRTDDRGADDEVPMGTPAYMAPEQAQGERADARSDLWALGVLLHEMLTGRRPARDGLASPDELGPAVHALVAGLLAADPADRPESAGDVRAAIESLLAELEAAAATPRIGARAALPTPLTPLVGRTRELADGARLLDGTRLLTLTGPGGTGKSRLAIELATRERARFADGACFVSLAELPAAGLVPGAVATALGVRDLGGAPLRDRIVAAIGARRILLLLDNFEHVPDAAEFVAGLLAACPGVTALVTSRAAVGVPGEQLLPVPPLGVSPDDLAESEAVTLFVRCARAADPAFTLDDDVRRDVAEICRRLDGLPLAIELAAARARLLSPRAMRARLEQRLDLLRAEPAARTGRHGTMRAVLDWSHNLLDDVERTLFSRLSVFVGGAPLAGAEALAPATGADVLALLASLSGKSLLMVEQQPDGEPRFLMLETVRAYALERLLASEEDATMARRAHRAFCVSHAERLAEGLRGPGQVAALDALERDYANFRAALDGASRDGPAGMIDAARLAVALHRLWLVRGPLFDGIERLRVILAALDTPALAPAHHALLARVVSAAAHLAGGRSLFREARDLFTRSLELYRALGDEAGVAVTLNNLAWQLWNVGDLAAGESLSREAMAIHQSRNDVLGLALSRNNLAWIAMERGDFAGSAERFEAVIASHQARGDIRGATFATSWLGALEERRGDPATAIALHERALHVGDAVADIGYRTLVLVRVAASRHALDDGEDQAAIVEARLLPVLREAGRLWPLSYALGELGVMLLDHDELARARAAFDEARRAHDETGSAAGIATTALRLAMVALRDGEPLVTAARLHDAFAVARAYGGLPLVVDALEGAARYNVAAGNRERAVTLLACADATRERIGMRRAPREHRASLALRAELGTTLGAEDFASAWQAGVAMPPDALLDVALDGTPPIA